MIQRIQTVYLSVVVIACVLLFFFPLAKYHNDVQGTYVLMASGMKYMIEPPVIVEFWRTFPMLALLAGTLVLAGISIFLFKKRMTQLLLVNIAFLLNVVLIILIFLYYTGHFEKIFQVLPSYQWGVFLPLASMVCLILASRAIRKDEMLVRSSDRLR
jgi:hypothetical protein